MFIDDSILECEADHDTVLRIVKKAQEILGLDKDKSTLFEIHHPVCVCTGPRDSRPSTNCDELIHAILAVVHETGHGLYKKADSGAELKVQCMNPSPDSTRIM